MKVIIIGGGFGGLRLARKLSNRAGFEITLIDRFNYHQFQPLFYQVATAGLDASNISFPIRKVFQQSKNIQFRLAEVKQVLPQDKKLVTDVGTFEYDALVIATGADTNFFGNQQLAEHAFPMKSTVEALQLRHRLLHNFEDALVAKDAGDQITEADEHRCSRRWPYRCGIERRHCRHETIPTTQRLSRTGFQQHEHLPARRHRQNTCGDE